MGDSSFAERIKAINLMLAGLSAHPEQLGKRGVTAEDVTKLQASYSKANIIDAEQEALKAGTKVKTVGCIRQFTV